VTTCATQALAGFVVQIKLTLLPAGEEGRRYSLSGTSNKRQRESGGGKEGGGGGGLISQSVGRDLGEVRRDTTIAPHDMKTKPKESIITPKGGGGRGLHGSSIEENRKNEVTQRFKRLNI